MYRVIEPSKIKPAAKRKTPKILLTLIVVAAALTGLYLRPVQPIKPSSSLKNTAETESAASLDWPLEGESAVGAVGYGVLDSGGMQTARPTASTAKLIDALTVLHKYPLKPGESGPLITLSNADVAIYDKYVAEQGSVAKITAGEQLSEYQMLQAMMLPSANNIADSLAIWAFGSFSAYRSAAQQTLALLNLTHTKIGSDASGFLPDTVSTAHDLVLLGEAAMENPALARIVGQPEATLPVAGLVTNYNSLLGQGGIVGVKTGNSEQAGGVFIFAAKYPAKINSGITIVGAVQGLSNLQSALNAAMPLLKSAEQNFKDVTITQAGQTVATYSLPWGGTVQAVAAQNLSTYIWNGQQPTKDLNLRAIKGTQKAGTTVGSLSISPSANKSPIDVVLKQKINPPPWWWRIVRLGW